MTDAGAPLVLDTNVLLDLFVFNDPEVASLKIALLANQLNWRSTPAMRDELERVLTYPKITHRMAFYQVSAAEVLAQFDQFATLVDAAPRATWICKDPDDQKFIDLAVLLRATLLSKDQAVLCMGKRLLASGVIAQTAIEYVA
ncbi:MAG: putative toxin-antitoxin system toxin component, PIN family [Burkholderiaceae bacterium]|nr:putative toxin-antitoxin system toxin component, PIN family [Burkholderiaceae bacterium]